MNKKSISKMDNKSTSKMDNKSICKIEEILEYSFNNKGLLERAFTHSSASSLSTKNYQSLEFLGDSILAFVVAKRLMELHPNEREGNLTKLRASLVSNSANSAIVNKLGLSDFLIVGKGENQEDIANQEKIQSDIFEAIIAAIYLDANSFEVVEKFVLKMLCNSFKNLGKATISKDYKSEINEFCAKNNKKFDYKIVKQTVDASNENHFVVDLLIDGAKVGKGEGTTRKNAEQQAAKDALSTF